jgi:hypothetical protein
MTGKVLRSAKNNQSIQNGPHHFLASTISYAYSLGGAHILVLDVQQSRWEVG